MLIVTTLKAPNKAIYCIAALNNQYMYLIYFPFITNSGNADSCSLQCVTFIKHNEILTGNMRGLMKIWDLRSPANEEPANTFMFSSDQVAATCLTVHPTQRHMVVAGDEEGMYLHHKTINFHADN